MHRPRVNAQPHSSSSQTRYPAHRHHHASNAPILNPSHRCNSTHGKHLETQPVLDGDSDAQVLGKILTRTFEALDADEPETLPAVPADIHVHLAKLLSRKPAGPATADEQVIP